MKEIKAYIRPAMLQGVLDALQAHPELPGVTCSDVTGFGRNRPAESGTDRCTSMTKLEIVVAAEQVQEALRILLQFAQTGRAGDGMVFISPVEEAIRIRTGQSEGL